MELVVPNLHRLPAYVDALRRGWSPDNLRPAAADEELAAIAQDADAFLRKFDFREAAADPVILPDGSSVPRLPGFRRWIWQDGFCGSIGLRWQPGTEDLPPTCSGHVGYAVVPWRRGEGLASSALQALLPDASAAGLRYIDVTVSPDNPASIRVIEKAGGVLVRRFDMLPELGGGIAALYRVQLDV